MPFEFKRLSIPDVVLITPRSFTDNRGFFMETYKESDFASYGLPTSYLQDNQSRSDKGILRGLHYQLQPQAQGKLVRVVTGKIFDVAVDIRKNSPTFGKWVSAELSEQNKAMLWLPAGFAHGVLVLEDNTNLLYKCTAEYAPKLQRSIIWNDPEIAIDWPLESNLEPLVADKDKNGQTLAQAEINFSF